MYYWMYVYHIYIFTTQQQLGQTSDIYDNLSQITATPTTPLLRTQLQHPPPQRPPRLDPPPRMLRGGPRVRVRQRPREQLHRDPSVKADVEERPRDLEHGQVPAAVLLAGEQTRVPRPAHPRRLPRDVELVAREKW